MTSALLKKLFSPRRPEPSYPKLPAVDAAGQTSVKGIYAVGEVAGTPLIKLGVNAGQELVRRLAPTLGAQRGRGDDVLDLLIVGAGASGLGAADAAAELGFNYVVVEANRMAETVQTMMKGKLLLAEPLAVETQGRLWFEECTREQLLAKWSKQVADLGLNIRTYEKVEDVQRRDGTLEVTTNKTSYRANVVVFAIGKAGNPRKAGVPGEVEHAAKIEHRLIDADDYEGLDILIYGGGDVALEAAIALADTNRVSLVTIDQEFTYPKKRNVDALKAKEAEGKLTIYMDSWLASIGEKDASFTIGGRDGAKKTIANDHVFEMIGAELPLPFFDKVGIKLANAWTAKRWFVLALVFVCVYSLYALKSYGKGGGMSWPYESLIAPESYYAGLEALFRVGFAPFAWAFQDWALADVMTNHGFQQGYLYSLLYTIIMVTFGWQALLRWRAKATNKKYQTWRFVSLITFQVVFFIGVNLIAVHGMTVQYAWRAWGLYQPFPLFFNTFFWWEGTPARADHQTVMWFFIIYGAIATLVLIPLAARWHGKRFCTWVCGCGGLAETLGDRWRHLSAKGARSRSWEFQGAVVLAASVLVLVVVDGMYHTSGNNPWWRAYNYVVDFWLVAVIPIALYPFFGGKVWCRYWCPLAKMMNLMSALYVKLGLSRFAIHANDKCIACGECSRNCQVGIDVMNFALKQEEINNANSSCIGCGICVTVCPMDTLSSGPAARRRPALVQIASSSQPE